MPVILELCDNELSKTLLRLRVTVPMTGISQLLRTLGKLILSKPRWASSCSFAEENSRSDSVAVPWKPGIPNSGGDIFELFELRLVGVLNWA